MILLVLLTVALSMPYQQNVHPAIALQDGATMGVVMDRLKAGQPVPLILELKASLK